MLGRRHVRRLHSFLERRSVGASAHVPQADAQHAATDVAARAEPAGLPPLRRHGSGSLRGEGGGKRDGRVPHLRCVERYPQRAARGGRGAARRQACAGHHLLHRQPAAYHHRLRGDGGTAAGAGLRFDLHQGHGGAAEAATGLRSGEGHQAGLRRGNARTCARARHHRRHHGEPHESHRGGGGLRGYLDQLAQSGSRPQSHRKPDGDAGRHAVFDPRG